MDKNKILILVGMVTNEEVKEIENIISKISEPRTHLILTNNASVINGLKSSNLSVERKHFDTILEEADLKEIKWIIITEGVELNTSVAGLNKIAELIHNSNNVSFIKYSGESSNDWKEATKYLVDLNRGVSIEEGIEPLTQSSETLTEQESESPSHDVINSKDSSVKSSETPKTGNNLISADFRVKD